MAANDPKRERFLAQAAQLYDAFLARSGPESGDRFDDMEIQAEAAGRALVVQLLADRLGEEVGLQPPETTCPQCGRPMRLPPQAAARQLETASGRVPYQRRHAICDHCGNSFSPAGPPARHPLSGSVQPPQAQSL